MKGEKVLVLNKIDTVPAETLLAVAPKLNEGGSSPTRS